MAGERGGLWANSQYQFTGAEVVQLMKDLGNVFDAVRLVEPESARQWMLDESDVLREGEYECWMIWSRGERCSHCISRRVLDQRTRVTKFEFANDDLHHITAKYIEVDGKPLSMEMVCKVPDETILEGYGRQDIVEAITRHNQRVYTDPLTGAFNRRYLDEMFAGTVVNRAVAIIDVDDFKRVNDTYGHGVGDQALKGVVEAINACVRSADAVIRFGGDEFVVIFDGMAEDMLPRKLEQIRQRVQDIQFQDVPGLELTVSIGAAYRDGAIMEQIDRADRMLYRAKENGKDRVRIEPVPDSG